MLHIHGLVVHRTEEHRRSLVAVPGMKIYSKIRINKTYFFFKFFEHMAAEIFLVVDQILAKFVQIASLILNTVLKFSLISAYDICSNNLSKKDGY